MSIWWLTEAVPIAVTSLLPLVLIPAFGVMDAGAISAPYANKTNFLFLGGLMIATAIERWGLHRRIALHVLAAFGDRPARLVLGFMVATAGDLGVDIQRSDDDDDAADRGRGLRSRERARRRSWTRVEPGPARLHRLCRDDRRLGDDRRHAAERRLRRNARTDVSRRAAGVVRRVDALRRPDRADLRTAHLALPREDRVESREHTTVERREIHRRGARRSRTDVGGRATSAAHLLRNGRSLDVSQTGRHRALHGPRLVDAVSGSAPHRRFHRGDHRCDLALLPSGR